MYYCLQFLRIFWVAWLVVLLIALTNSGAFSFVLPDTGITTCFDSGGNEIICPQQGESYYGQDAHFGPGSMTFQDNGDGTLTDTNTSLNWERKFNADGNPDVENFADADNLYTWSQVQILVADMNAGSGYLGYNDWRLPSVEELDYLVDLSVEEPGPMIDSAFLPNTIAGKYWSIDIDAENAASAWAIDFSTSIDESVAQTELCHVRLVRGGGQ